VALGTAASLVPADCKGRALAVLLAGTTMATIVGVPGGAVLGTLLGWRATFWVIVLLCAPAALGIAKVVPAAATGAARTSAAGVALRTEIAELARPRLLLVMVLGALVNAATFATFTFLAPIVTNTAGLGPWWVPVGLVLFGTGSFIGVTVAGRLADGRPAAVIGLGGVALCLGWLALAVLAVHPAMLLLLVFVQGALSFAVGSTLIARVLYEADGAPTMAGSYATAALNVGAAGGPLVAAAALGARVGDLGPVWVSAVLVAVALLIALPLLRVIAPRTGGTGGG